MTHVIDLLAEVQALDLGPDRIDMFIENTRATLWWHDETARARLLDRLGSLDCASMVPREDLVRFGIHFDDDSYGDAYLFAHPGSTFFPNDFYQPIANIALALKDRGMRTRRWRPWHVGDHAYIADTDAELGFMLLAADGYATDHETVVMADIAPSILELLGRRPPASMTGRAIFGPRDRAQTKELAVVTG